MRGVSCSSSGAGLSQLQKDVFFPGCLAGSFFGCRYQSFDLCRWLLFCWEIKDSCFPLHFFIFSRNHPTEVIVVVVGGGVCEQGPCFLWEAAVALLPVGEHVLCLHHKMNSHHFWWGRLTCFFFSYSGTFPPSLHPFPVAFQGQLTCETFGTQSPGWSYCHLEWEGAGTAAQSK